MNQRLFLDNLAKKLKIKKLEDWKNVSITKLKEFGGTFMLNQNNNSIFKLLKNVYPGKETIKKIYKFVNRINRNELERRMV